MTCYTDPGYVPYKRVSIFSLNMKFNLLNFISCRIWLMELHHHRMMMTTMVKIYEQQNLVILENVRYAILK